LVLLTTLEEKVEGHLREALNVFQNLDDATLLKSASNGGWSIAQCLEHLNRYGNYYLPEIQKELKKNKSNTRQPWFKSSWLGYQFTKMLDPATGKKKIKTFKNYNPQPELNAPAVVAEFIKQQEALLLLLREAQHTDLNNIRIPVSIARFIRLKLGDVFQFLVAHNDRHVLQAKRNL